jgi:hypothetical protein
MRVKENCDSRINSRLNICKFAGFEPCDTRIATFDKLATKMPSNAYHYWKQHLDQIQAGVVYQGKFEKYLTLLCH